MTTFRTPLYLWDYSTTILNFIMLEKLSLYCYKWFHFFTWMTRGVYKVKILKIEKRYLSNDTSIFSTCWCTNMNFNMNVYTYIHICKYTYVYMDVDILLLIFYRNLSMIMVTNKTSSLHSDSPPQRPFESRTSSK